MGIDKKPVDTKTNALFITLRMLATQQLAAIEDYLDTPYDQSALANRRAKVRKSSLVSKVQSGN